MNEVRKKMNLLKHKGFIYSKSSYYYVNEPMGIMLSVDVTINLSLLELFELIEYIIDKKTNYNKEKEDFNESFNS